jgi:MipA family protein
MARNGIDAALLEDRDHGFDVGLSAKWAGSAGELEWELLTDATSASEGHIVSADYGYPMQWGKAQVTPHFGATWLSRASAEYYYGTLDEERARGVLDYKPDAALVPHVGISAIRPLGQSWTMFGSMEYTRLPGELSDSPLVEADTSGYGTMRFGILRRF